MPDKKISELDAITGSATAADDFFIVVDSSGASTNKISRAELNNAIEQDVLAQVDITSANIDGGTIDNTPIGSATPSTGVFTDLTATGTTSIAGVLSNVVEDTTPQLGGNLDVNGNDITGTGDINITGTITSDGLTVDGDSDLTHTTPSNVSTMLTLRDNRTTTSEENYILAINRQNSTTPAIYLGNNDSNNAIIAGNNTATLIGYDVSGTFTSSAKFNNNGDISFYDSTGVSQGLYWDASTQRLGLGETSPESTLTVRDSGAEIRLDDASNNPVFRFMEGGTSKGKIETTAGDMRFYAGGVLSANRYMTITSGGLVGIGTDSPSTLVGGGDKILHIKDSTSGNFAELVLDGNRGTTSAASGAIAFGNNGTGIARIIGQPDASSATKGAIVFDTHNGSSFQEAARIDSSQNLLVGKTSIGVSTVGVEARGSGILSATRSGGEPLTLNRTTSDGTIIDIKQDGTTLGSIGVNSDLTIDGASGETGLKFGNSGLVPRFNGADNDTNVSLGLSNRRFSDLYLSGRAYINNGIKLDAGDGIYFGQDGTAANKLDDYEEGETVALTMTPQTSGTITLNGSYDTLKYTKIGDSVTVSGQFVVSSVASPVGLYVSLSLPFTSASGLSNRYGTAAYYYTGGGVESLIPCGVAEGSTNLRIHLDASTIAAGHEFWFDVTYKAA